MPTKDPEKLKAIQKRCYDKRMATPEGRADAAQRQADYRARHPERVAAAKKAYRETPEGRAKINADIARHKATPEGREKESKRKKDWAARPESKALISAAHNRRWENDPNYRLAHMLRTRLRKALRRSLSSASAIKLLGIDLDSFMKHIESLWQPGMTWDNHGTEWHLDHKKALGLFDLTDPVQQAEAAHYTNIQPLSTAEHNKKTAADLLLIRARKVSA